MNSGETPSAVLFARLQQNITPTPDQVERLRSRRYITVSDEGIRGLITGVEGGVVSYVPYRERGENIPEGLRAERTVTNVTFLNIPKEGGAAAIADSKQTG